MRLVLGVTGVRSEYGLLRPVFRAVEAHPDLELKVAVMGTHLVPELGATYREVEADRFEICDRIHSFIAGDTPATAVKSLGVGLVRLTQTIERVRPDFVLVLGDRNEALAAAVAASQMYVPVAHVHGGDLMDGYNVDDAIRYSITHFAHVHFAASRLSAARLLKVGEEPFRIYISGAPGLDPIVAGDLPDPKEVQARYGLRLGDRYLVVLQHPVTSEWDRAGEQMVETLEAVKDSGLPAVVIYPNSDPGTQRIVHAIERYADGRTIFSVPTMGHWDFLALVGDAAALVGNSSSGIIEVPSLRTPVINVGGRQKGRERGRNVLDVDHDRRSIRRAIDRALTDREFLEAVASGENPYGDGGAGPRIAKVLAEVEIDERLLRKRFSL